VLSANDPRVVSFYNAIHYKPKDSNGFFIGSKQNAAGLLYVIGGEHPMIQVWLPPDLLDYANAAAGTSGDRAVGIRRTGFSSVQQAANEILRIFSSPQSLANFINTSECDFTGVTGRPVRGSSVTIEPLAKDDKNGFWAHYTKETMAFLKSKFGKTLVAQAYDTLTLKEFEGLFQLDDHSLQGMAHAE
jgi:hypothetical protein